MECMAAVCKLFQHVIYTQVCVGGISSERQVSLSNGNILISRPETRFPHSLPFSFGFFFFVWVMAVFPAAVGGPGVLSHRKHI